MNNRLLSLFCLKELEQNQNGLTTDEMIARTGNAGFVPLIPKTFQRELHIYREYGIEIRNSRRRHILHLDEKSLKGFMKFLHDFSKDEDHAHIFYGDIDSVRGLNYFSSQHPVISHFYSIIMAIIEGRYLDFTYTPQSDLTRLRMLQRSKHEATNPRVIPVHMLPHHIVTGGNSFLVLGEYFEKKGFYKSLFKAPVQRHYEMRGISGLKIGEKGEKQLTINAQETYRNSIHVWAGGREYEVELEEFWYEGGKPRRKKRKVNGEDEVLSLAAGSLGRIRIVNPPEELRNRAKQIGLPEDLVFRFDN
jgi:hypothetical protein